MTNPETLLSFTQGYNLQYPPGCWHDVLIESARKHSADTALVCLHQSHSFLKSITRSSGETCLRWTFEELLRASHAFAQKLAESGIKPGSLIAAFIFNGAEFHIGFRAACELGCAFSPLDPEALGNSMETKHLLELLKPAVIITPDVTAASKLEVAAPDTSNKALVKLLSNSSNLPAQACEGWQGLEEFITSWDEKDSITNLEIVRDLDDISLVMMTSSTTSLPKGCPHTSRNFIPAITSVSLAMALDKEGRRPVCCQVPLHHISGVLMTLDYHLWGHKIVHPSATLDPKSTLQALVQEKCSDLSGTPEMYSAILGHPDFEKSMMSSVKVSVLAGTTILEDHCRMVEHEMGAGKVCIGFAETEYGASFLQRPWDNYDRRKNNVGKILAGCKARICKLNSKEPVPRGERGEIHIGGPFLIQEYLVHPSVSSEEANRVFYDDEDGHWLRNGNEGVMDESGMLSIVGRIKD